MSHCFEFSTAANGKIEGKLHDLSKSKKTIFDLCGEMRAAGKKGFLVRAHDIEEAEKRLASLPPVHKNVETVFIL